MLRILSTLMVLVLLAQSACAQPQPDAPPDSPFRDFTRGWRDDRVWYDGKAECAVYDAQRVIYGKNRTYQARLFTNKEYVSAETKTKSATGRGREVFKHHLREQAPTKNYTYYFSTMVYVGASDLKSLKIDMGSQEDCGATFKQYINHHGKLDWSQFSYFPNEGHKVGSYQPGADLVFHDALTLVLRGYPFDKPRDVSFAMLSDQTNTHFTSGKPSPAVVGYVGRETLDLPWGAMVAHHLKVTSGGQAYDYWFADDRALQHVLVKYEDHTGLKMVLRSVERRAYWQR